jgi:hypothetical protein
MDSKLKGSMLEVVVSGKMIHGQWIEHRKDMVMLWYNVDHSPQEFHGTVIQKIEQSPLLHHFFLYVYITTVTTHMHLEVFCPADIFLSC